MPTIGTLRLLTHLLTRELIARKRRARCTLGIQAQSTVTAPTTPYTGRPTPAQRSTSSELYIPVVLGIAMYTCCRMRDREIGLGWRFSDV